MDPDNAFNEIFGKKPSTEQKTEPQNSLEDTSAIKEQYAGEKAMSVPMVQPLIRSATSPASVTKTS